MSENIKQPSMLDALIPVLFLILSLAASVYLYGEDSSYGPNQIALVMSAAIAGLIAYKNGLKWDALQEGLTAGIQMAMGAILILFCVGMLIGSWMLSGTVPTMIIYGIELLNPSLFYPAACLISAIVAISIGSSWSTAGTVGVAFIGIASALQLDPAITAGAVISGAYMGDKLSPLSDTTNLAPAVAGTELFAHIKHMLWTTVPAFIIAMILFSFLGFGAEGVITDPTIDTIKATLSSEFHIAWYMLFPMVVLLVMANRKIPALPSVIVGSLVGVIFSLLFQQDAVLKMANTSSISTGTALEFMNGFFVQLKGIWSVLFGGLNIETGVSQVDSLINKGGMASMNNTVWLIISAMAFGGMMEKAGLVNKLVQSILARVSTVRGLLASTLATAFGTNLIASDQYMSIVMPGRMYKAEFEKRNLDSRNLSRAIEDAGTVTSALIPWNTCGAFMAGALGVATIDYLPYAFFNIFSPIVALVSAWFLFKVIFVKPSPKSEAAE
ncbi:Na+/H+ antiporter NhaC [Temperatibacter marinus]|uniref:Na+/H+ antiporter NhaC n=1 Tax=Temperatibacter marinus TaxID=1456591 RepID=A0AA52EIV1_9PROT|nr:Na+/H+ antiporter NhaC [Temperatibacter marinus]WND03963.1 Na+/H+ antiporter NhaC [Temperatibacter marinus]